MKKYAVSKQFAHFVQVWHVEAKSKGDAWVNAEENGRLMFQSVYKDVIPLRNYVTCIDETEDNTISQEQYNEWLKEARELGMKDDYYCDLPFNDVY